MAERQKNTLPTNYDELKRLSNDKANWRNRKAAVEELGKWNSKETKDILRRLMLTDPLYKVQHAAFLKLQGLGENVRLPRKRKGNEVKGIHSILAKVKNSLPDNHTFEQFKEVFKKKRPVEYDIYEGEKGDKIDEWLKNVWTNLPKKKTNN